MKHHSLLFLSLPFLGTLLMLIPPTASRADDWPAWRGPDATGAATAAGFPARWGADQLAWQFPLPGKGVSTPIVWQGRIYLTTPVNGQDGVLALDAATGKQRWLTQLGPESRPRHKTLASSCNASPVTDGQAIFVRFRSGRLAALTLDGAVRWQLNLDERFGPERLFWDQGSSPLLTSRDVIVTRMHHGDSWVAAFDKATGKLHWLQKRNYETPTEDDNGYTTPLRFDYKGQPAILVWGAEHLTAYTAADGALLWSCAGFNPKAIINWPAIASPVLAGGVAIVPVGRDDRSQGHVHGIRLGGSGDVTATHRAWQRDDMGVFCCSPVLYDGRAYLLRHRGEIVCLDPATGKTLWTGALPASKTPYYASPVVAGGILVAAREDGVVFTARVTGNRLELLGENPMGERIVASPVPAGNRLLLRGDQHLFCIAGKPR